MKKNTRKFLLPLAMIALSAPMLAAQAAGNAELKVTGAIKTVACTPTLGGNGTVDFGVIPASSLPAGKEMALHWTPIDISISCQAPVKMALRVLDNRSASSTHAGSHFSYGLGMVGGAKVGRYNLVIVPGSIRTDGAPAHNLFSVDGNQSWIVNGNGGQMGTDRAFSWTTAGGNTPAPFKEVRMSVYVVPYLNRPENLPLTQDIPLDGSATVEIQYL
ncbi:DUF1120 domain-containing protein [Herbaspirillum robiniae]|uniref:DUF1120 domain-containing protein n=1 Tax=Herbaspirillum robiniae TaxID=2014887 RepID=A0A246WTY6_9BURK|nr:DUF1120 domain-containing protein [Herbaspirillum robiniae]OWY30520.1 hypothetical protein CEJ42_00040 [Herbaspirillum robiniae]